MARIGTTDSAAGTGTSCAGAACTADADEARAPDGAQPEQDGFEEGLEDGYETFLDCQRDEQERWREMWDRHARQLLQNKRRLDEKQALRAEERHLNELLRAEALDAPGDVYCVSTVSAPCAGAVTGLTRCDSRRSGNEQD